MNNKPYFLALNRMHKMGPRTVMKLAARWPRLEDMFQLSLTELEASGLPTQLAANIHGFDLNTIEADLNWEKANDRHLLTWEDEAYPALLKEIPDPPLVLYAEGDLACLKQPTLAIIGTRKPSISGSETAFRFANQLAMSQITIVSGLAYGIDAMAHEGCLAARGRTVAVMGTGIDTIYPRAHSRLAGKIREQGLLLSEFPLKSAANAGHFPRRNRIISGLSLATLIVEAAIRSGSLITARLALEQNRDVLAIPGSIHNPQARGCHHLLQQGAKLVTSIQDVIDELGITQPIAKYAPASLSLASSEGNLVKCIGFEVTTIDQIIQRSGFNMEAVTCNLAQLELQGAIKAVPGGYERCIATAREESSI